MEASSLDIRTLAELLIGFPNLINIFGQDWVNDQVKSGFFPLASQRLAEIDIAINNMKEIKGFSQWVKNARKNPQGYEHYEFEIIMINRIAKNADEIELYPKIPNSNNFAELRVVINMIEYYVEITKFSKISNKKNKIKKLLEKGRKQIPKNSVGFIVVDVSEVTLVEIYKNINGELIYDLDSNIDDLALITKDFFKGNNTRFLGVVLVEPYLIVNYENQVGIETHLINVFNDYNKLGLNASEVGKIIKTWF
jgi:hypothetical protein